MIHSENGMPVSMLSAFDIESIGVAEDVVEAVGIMQQRYPSTPLFNRSILEEKGLSYLASILETWGSFIMLPKHRQSKDRFIYIRDRFFGSGAERMDPE